ncbi:hypothetical protein P9112_013747 [Eukaryota sp. TZLM1-RC]
MDPAESTIADEYKLWKKNTPYLYDVVLTHALDWPSLTVEWLNESENDVTDPNYTLKRLVVGTHTSGNEPDYLRIAELRLPNKNVELDIAQYETGPGEVGGYGVAQSHVKIIQSIPHPGEVNRARVSPHQSNLIATKDPQGKVNIFDFTKHSSRPRPTEKPNPNMVLNGHSAEGYGLGWSRTTEGLVVSGSYDKLVCVWDIREDQKHFDPLWTSVDHKDNVEDVEFHPFTDQIIASVSDDGVLLLHDRRTSESPPISKQAHDGAANSLSWSRHRDTLLLTGGADQVAKLWDTRYMENCRHEFAIHEDEVYNVAFSPFKETVFATSSADRRVAVWDISRIGASQTSEEVEDGPPELLFIHGGHTNRVNDFAFCPHEDWMMASVADDNVLQVWEMASCIHAEVDPSTVSDSMVE